MLNHRRIVLWAALSLSVGGCRLMNGAESGQLPALTSEQWREDLRQFATELPRRHANAFHATPRDQFERAVAQLDADIPSLLPHQIVVRLLQITAAVGDLHTHVQLPQALPRYPLTLFWFGSDLRIVRAAPAYEAALGGSVVAIDGMPIAEVQQRILSVCSRAENEWHVLGASSRYLTFAAVLHSLGVVKQPGRASFTFRTDEGREDSVEVEPIVPSSALESQMRGSAASEPLFRQRPDEPFWFTYLENSQTIYVSFRRYDSLADHVRKLFQLVDTRSTRRLIIDMRQNAGGDYTKVRETLIPAIKRRSAINARGSLFVVTGRRTLSAAMNSAADLRRDTNAILVGEPPGERPNSYQEGDDFRLRRSGVVVSYSTRYYKFADQDVPAIMPDQRIDPTWPEYKAGRDAVLEWILGARPQ